MSDKLREAAHKVITIAKGRMPTFSLGAAIDELEAALAEPRAAPAVGQLSDNDINFWISTLPALTSNGRTFRYVTVSDVNALLRSEAAKEPK